MLNSPRLLNLPLLLLANKQDAATSLSVSEIREGFDAWQRARSSERRDGGSPGLGEGERERGKAWDDGGAKEERMASLDVMGVSALEGWVRLESLLM